MSFSILCCFLRGTKTYLVCLLFVSLAFHSSIVATRISGCLPYAITIPADHKLNDNLETHRGELAYCCDFETLFALE